jgi:hypothetical protein
VLSLRRQLATTESERDQLRRETDAVSRQADSLNDRLLAQVRKGHDDGGAQAEDIVRLSNLLHELKVRGARRVPGRRLMLLPCHALFCTPSAGWLAAPLQQANRLLAELLAPAPAAAAGEPEARGGQQGLLQRHPRQGR